MPNGKIVRKAFPYANVVATGQATNQLMIGKTINEIELKLGGTSLTKAMLTMVRVKANAKTIVEGSGTQLEAINAYRGHTADAAFLHIPFEDLSGLDQADRYVGALDTSIGIANLTTEVDIVGATAPTLSARVHEAAPQRNADGSQAAYAGLIAKTLRYPFSVASAGDLPLNFPFGPNTGAIIKRVHVFASTVTGAVVKEDGVVVHESLKAENDAFNVRNGRVPQADVYTIDFIPDGNVRNALDTRRAQSMDWIFTHSGAGTGTVLIEYIDRLGNL